MSRAPGFEPEPGVRQQVDLPNDSFGKSSRLPRSRHTVPCEGILLGAPEIQPPCKRRLNFCIFHCGANLSLSLRRSTINVENVGVRLWQSRSICLRAFARTSLSFPRPGPPQIRMYLWGGQGGNRAWVVISYLIRGIILCRVFIITKSAIQILQTLFPPTRE